MTLRIAKFIAQSGRFSRREAERLLERGVVTLNGQPLARVAQLVDPARDKVRVCASN